MLVFFTYLVIIFGVFELTSNILYLLMKNGLNKAYNQHKEVPATVSISRMKAKVITTLLVGIVFLTTGLYALKIAEAPSFYLTGVLALYAIYNWGESIYYKHKTGFALSVLVTALALTSGLWT